MIKIVKIDKIKKIENIEVPYFMLQDVKFPFRQPIELFECDGEYYLVDGNKRLEKAKWLKHEFIEARVEIKPNIFEVVADYTTIRAIASVRIRKRDLRDILLMNNHKDKTIAKLSRELRISMANMLKLLWS